MSHFQKTIRNCDAIYHKKVSQGKHEVIIHCDHSDERITFDFDDIQSARRLILVLDGLLVSWHNDREALDAYKAVHNRNPQSNGWHDADQRIYDGDPSARDGKDGDTASG